MIRRKFVNITNSWSITLCAGCTGALYAGGDFARLQKALGKAPDEKWTADDKAEVVSLMNWITKAYNAHGGDKCAPPRRMLCLLLLRLYKLDELKTYSPAQFAAIDAVWDNVLALERPEPVKLSTQPSAPAKRTACWTASCRGSAVSPAT